MSTRRQPSTTSLSKYARAHSPPPDLYGENGGRDPSVDFCNAFWGLGDGGVEVLFARMRGAGRTMEELRNFWKERAMIEEQYAKRLATLAKTNVGKDEIGEMRASLDTLRTETERQSGFHLQVAQQIKQDLEGQTLAFLAKQQHHKKIYQAGIDKAFKTKQAQESHVLRAREKYESDCAKINSFTAQATLAQGKELEKLNTRRGRAEETVQANEKDFARFARELKETVAKWEVEWKAFCDSCQDLEEERLEFMKDNMWAYANAVSTVCVADDESCEILRLALEQLEPEKDMENFVREYGTGNAIPDPPSFVNYADPNAVPSASQRPSTRPASFTRSTNRQRQSMIAQPPPPPPPEEEREVGPGAAGVGVGRLIRAMSQSRAASRAALMQEQQQARAQSQAQAQPQTNGQTPYTNGHTLSRASATAPVTNPRTSMSREADPDADPIDPRHQTMIKVGDQAYAVDLSRDPQANNGTNGNANAGQAAALNVGAENDPLAEKMKELQRGGGSVARRSGQWPGVQDRGSVSRPAAQPLQSPQAQAQANAQARRSVSPTKPRTQSTDLSPPLASSGQNASRVDYRRSAEIVVGAPPPSASRPVSPNPNAGSNPPTASFMLPPAQGSAGPSSNLPVDAVLATYHQSLPGERRSISSRPPSRAESTRPMSASIEGHAGIGARGRSTSPQPFVPLSRSTSPNVNAIANVAPGQASKRNSYNTRVPAPSVNGQSNPARQGSVSSVSVSSVSSTSVPTMTTNSSLAGGNSVGIALDPSGRVAQDDMANQYRDQHRQQKEQEYRPQQPQQQQPPQAQPQRRPSYVTSAPSNALQRNQPPPQNISPSSQMYPSATPAPAYPQQPAHPYSVVPMHQAAQPIQQQYGQNMYAPPQAYAPPAVDYSNNMVQRGPSMNGYYGHGVVQQQPQQPIYRAPSPRAPSPQPPPANQPPPTGQYTEDGRGVLFYVQALYDYQATIDEEFDFQAGDIIAVTATPEDGWWSGELLDEARRRPGRHVFPSNFVSLF